MVCTTNQKVSVKNCDVVLFAVPIGLVELSAILMEAPKRQLRDYSKRWIAIWAIFRWLETVVGHPPNSNRAGRRNPDIQRAPDEAKPIGALPPGLQSPNYDEDATGGSIAVVVVGIGR